MTWKYTFLHSFDLGDKRMQLHLEFPPRVVSYTFAGNATTFPVFNYFLLMIIELLII
jgi:hypothetical protein